MRVDNAAEKQLIVADEELSSLEDVVRMQPATQYLNVAFNRLTDLAGLQQLPDLRSLNVSHNALTSLLEVATLPHLRVLKCSGNQIADLSWLNGLHGLEELWLRDNRVAHAQLVQLQPLTELRALIIHPNPCTESDNYVLMIVKLLPWLERVDSVVVTGELRMEAQHVVQCVDLDSAAADDSLLPVLGPSLDKPTTATREATPVTDAAVVPDILETAEKSSEVKVSAKSKKQLATEAFLRNFPVQEFIPVGDDKAAILSDNQQPSCEPVELLPQTETPSQTPPDVPTVSSGDSSVQIPAQEVLRTSDKAEASTLMDSVQTLPTFEGTGVLQKPKKLRAHLLPGRRKPKRTQATKTEPSSNQDATSPPRFHQDQEYSHKYPSSTVAAVQVRCDGSAVARWPLGSVAVSVDPERDGFRIYSAHRDGQLALSFDATGVGFLNAYPSGKTLISTTSTGDGLLFDAESGAILRQWDAHGNLRDGACQPVTALGDEPDGSLLCRLSEDLAVRVQLKIPQQQDNDDAPPKAFSSRNPILIHVYLATPPDIRHVFVNRANQAERSASEACDHALGKAVSKADKALVARAKKSPPVEHVDLLSSIRAAVAGL